MDPIRFFKAVDRRDVRVVERGEDFRFPLKPCETFRLISKRFRQDFDRDVALEPRVVGAIDLAL